MCCFCGGGNTSDTEREDCSDTNFGATDSYGDDCDYYEESMG